jgi:hypothetical protein
MSEYCEYRDNQAGRISRRHCLGTAAALLGMGLAGPARALRYEDQEFADSLQLAGSTLVLNGVGKRAVLMLRGYVAGLYMTRKARTPQEVLAVPGPKRLEIRMLLEVGSDEFVKAVKKGVSRNCSEPERAALADRLPQLTGNFELVGRVRRKDLITVDYLPAIGTVLAVNGKQWGKPVPGEDIYRAFLKVFLGQRVSDDALKAGLLGEVT